MRNLKKLIHTLKAFIFLLLFFVCIDLQSQEVDREVRVLQPEFISSNEGLAHGHIHTIIQDQDGFIWVGTLDGLSRYDGERFKTFTNDPEDPYSISHPGVISLLEIGDYIIVGTHGGINFFYKPDQRFYKITIPGIAKDQGSYERIHQDSLGHLWLVEGMSHRIIKITLPQDFINQPPTREAFSKINILTSNESDLSFPSSQGANQIGMEYFRENSDIYDINPKTKIHRVQYYEKDKQLWLYTDDGLALFNNWTPEITTLNYSVVVDVKNINHYTKDRSGIIWGTSYGYGMMKFNPRNFKIQHHLAGTNISNIPLMTRAGDILITSTFQDPVIQISDSKTKFKIPESFFYSLHRMRFIEYAENSFYIIGRTYDMKRIKIYNYHLGQEVQELISIPVDPGSIHPHTNASSYYEKENKSIWIAFAGNLINYHPQTNKFNKYDYSGIGEDAKHSCYDVTKTSNGHVWVATGRGLLHAIPSQKEDQSIFTFEMIRKKKEGATQLRNNVVTSLLTDSKDENILWIGTRGGGLHRLDTRDMSFSFLNTKNGLPNDVIYGILNDDYGNLWMSSNKGIIRYNPETFVIKNFTTAAGIQSNEFSTWTYAKSADGTMLFGGANGLNVFHPDDLKGNPYIPKVWITGLYVNNEAVNNRNSMGLLERSIEYTSEITLPFRQNNIALEFAALEFSAPLENKFRYYLEGAEAPWIHESTDNQAQYLKLQPGNYTFKIKVSNSDGVWNEQVKELKINILPPWYRTNLAYLGYFLLLGLGIWQFVKFRENRYRLKMEVEQKSKETTRLKELDEFKSRFYTNITHELRTPLTIIMGMSEQIKKAPDQWSLKGAKMIKQNANKLLHLVNQILELRKLDANELRVNLVHGDIVNYLRYLSESFKTFAQSKEIELHFLTAQPSILMDYDQDKILRIISNLLSNAIKYTEHGGNIYFHIDEKIENDHALLQLRVEDTGTGIPTSELPHIFDRFYQVDDTLTRKGEGTGIGLALTKELVQFLKGEIKVSSGVGKGTTFTVNIPITRNAQIEVGENLNTNSTVFEDTSKNKIAESKSEDSNPSFSASTIPSSSQQQNTSPTSVEDFPTILIVEDNTDVREFMIACLQDNYQITTAENGQEGISKAIELVPDLIVSDVMMPLKNGFELCTTLKEDKRTSHIPIILLTAKADIESKILGLEKGADAYLSKPFEPRELLVRLEKLLQLRKKLQQRYTGMQITLSDLPNDNNPLEDEFIQKIKNIIYQNMDDEDFGIIHLCRSLAMSRTQVHNKVKALTGKPTSIFIRTIRLYKGKELLETTDMTISEIAYEVGFKYPTNFSKFYSQEFGIRPSKDRK